jgi:hypothetical protein
VTMHAGIRFELGTNGGTLGGGVKETKATHVLRHCTMKTKLWPVPYLSSKYAYVDEMDFRVSVT